MNQRIINNYQIPYPKYKLVKEIEKELDRLEIISKSYTNIVEDVMRGLTREQIINDARLKDEEEMDKADFDYTGSLPKGD